MSPWNQENGCETLANLKPGCPAAVVGVDRGAKASLRLQELGFVPGMPVEVLMTGGTLLLRLGEQRLSMRLDQATNVAVLPIW